MTDIKVDTATERDEPVGHQPLSDDYFDDAPNVPGGAAAALDERLLATRPHPRDQDFNWDPTENDNVVCPEQQPVAIYTNTYGQAVIRQKANWPHDEEDPWIVISKHHLQDVIDRLQEILSRD